MKRKILLMGFLFISIFCLTGCFNKKVITKEEFESKLKEKGFNISEENTKPNGVDYVTNSTMAEKGEIQILYYEISDENKAKDVYNTFSDELEELDSKSSLTVNLGNHQKYEITTDKYFCFITRVEKTLVMVEVDKKLKDETIEALKEIGYY